MKIKYIIVLHSAWRFNSFLQVLWNNNILHFLILMYFVSQKVVSLISMELEISTLKVFSKTNVLSKHEPVWQTGAGEFEKKIYLFQVVMSLQKSNLLQNSNIQIYLNLFILRILFLFWIWLLQLFSSWRVWKHVNVTEFRFYNI